MPSHFRLRVLTDKCRSLTEAWHGRATWLFTQLKAWNMTSVQEVVFFLHQPLRKSKANISYIYEMFMKMAECDGSLMSATNSVTAGL